MDPVNSQSLVANSQNIVYMAGIAIANIAGLVTFFVSLKVSQAEMKVRLDRLEKDLDRLGSVIGTQRSKGSAD